MNEQNKKVPTVRFKGFTNDWEQRKLGETLTGFEYGLNTPATDYDGINKYLRITDIDDVSHKFDISHLTSPKLKDDNYLLANGDILFARTGASVGKSYRYSNIDGKVYYAGFLIKAHIKDHFSTNFIFDTTLLPRYHYFVQVTSMRSGQPGINAKEYQKYIIYTPSENEQNKISDLILTIQKLIDLQQRKLDLLKQLKKGLLQKMFADRDSKRPILRFGGFSNDWEQRKLDEIASLEDNKRKPVKESDRVPGKVPYYGANGIQDHVKGYTHTGEHVLVAEDGANSISNYPVYFICSPSWVNNHAHVLTGKELMTSNKFLTYDLMTVHYGKYLVGSGRYKLNAETLKIIPIRIPSLTEQKYIGGVLSKVDNIINLQQQKLKKISKVKESFLQQMFI